MPARPSLSGLYASLEGRASEASEPTPAQVPPPLADSAALSTASIKAETQLGRVSMIWTTLHAFTSLTNL